MNLGKGIVLLTVAISLSGCLKTSGGGGGGGGGAGGGGGGGGSAQTQYDTKRDAVLNTPVTTRQLTGSASYTGQALIDTIDGQGVVNGYVVGDLAVDVTFDPNSSSPMTGTATNFTGEVDGQAVSVAGTLSSDNTTSSNELNAISESSFVVPQTGDTVYTTGMSLALAGELTDNGSSGLAGDAYLTLQGTFVGTNGEGVHGAAGLTVDPATGAPLILGGTYYLEQ